MRVDKKNHKEDPLFFLFSYIGECHSQRDKGGGNAIFWIYFPGTSTHSVTYITANMNCAKKIFQQKHAIAYLEGRICTGNLFVFGTAFLVKYVHILLLDKCISMICVYYFRHMIILLIAKATCFF